MSPFQTQQLLDSKKLVIVDLDGTVRVCTNPDRPCPNTTGEQRLIDGALEAIWCAVDAGQTVVAATNQGGIGLGFMTEPDHDDICYELMRLLEEDSWSGLPGWEVYTCPHAPNDGCDCRKPKPGLLQQGMIAHGATPEDTVFIGDRDSDRGAAEAAGVDFIHAADWRAPYL